MKAATGPGPEELARIAALPAPCAAIVGQGAGGRPGQALPDRRRVRRRAGAAHGGWRGGRGGHGGGAVRRRLPRRGGALRRGAAAGPRGHRRRRDRGRRPESADRERPAPTPAPTARPTGAAAHRPDRAARAARFAGRRVYRTIQPCRALGELADVTVVSGSILSPALFARRRSRARGGGRTPRPASCWRLTSWSSVTSPTPTPARHRGPPSQRPAHRLRDRQPHLRARRGSEGAADRGEDLAARSLPPQLARQADCLQLATAALDAQFAGLNPRRAIFPSQLWDAPVVRSSARRRSRGHRVGAARGAERADLRAGAPRAGGRARAPSRGARRRSWATRAAGRAGGAARRRGCRSSPPDRSSARSGFSTRSTSGSRRSARPPTTAAAMTCASSSTRRTACWPSAPISSPYREVVRPGRPGSCFGTPPSSRPCSNERSPKRSCARPSRPAPPARRPSGWSARTQRTGWGSISRSRRRWGSASAARARARSFPPPELTKPAEAARHVPRLALPGARRQQGGSAALAGGLAAGRRSRPGRPDRQALRAFEEAETPRPREPPSAAARSG